MKEYTQEEIADFVRQRDLATEALSRIALMCVSLKDAEDIAKKAMAAISGTYYVR